MHTFSEELTLLTSVGLYNFVWSSFTFLASKVGALENEIPKKNFFKANHQMPDLFSPAVVFHGMNVIYFTYQVGDTMLIIFKNLSLEISYKFTFTILGGCSADYL